MNLDEHDDRIVAAAEYVAGTLDAPARTTFVSRLASDRDLQAEVYFWQDRLQPLADGVAPLDPDPGLWEAIAQRIAGAPEAANDPVWRRMRRWRATALLGMAASTVLATLLVLQPRPEATVRYLTLLQAPGTQRTGWVVEATSGQRIRLLPVEAAAAVPAGKSLQFWTKPANADRPTSLGLVQAGQPVDVPAMRSPALGEQQLFELTLEPESGSPTGLPTGPILFVGKSVRL